jgi:hypothetical protein
MKLTDFQNDILQSIACAYMDDPSPESGRTYMEGEETDDEDFEGEIPFDAAMALKKKGLLREVESGTFDCGTRYIHFGLTDAGFKAVA